MFCDICETYLKLQPFMYPLVRRLLMYHMTAIMAREMSPNIGSYCI